MLGDTRSGAKNATNANSVNPCQDNELSRKEKHAQEQNPKRAYLKSRACGTLCENAAESPLDVENTEVTANTSDGENGVCSENCTESTPKSGNFDPELARIVAAWPSLPTAIKAGIVAMVQAATGAGR